MNDKAYQLEFVPQGAQELLIRIAGKWELQHTLPSSESVATQLGNHRELQRIKFESSRLIGWDSALLTFLLRVRALCESNNVALDESGLPEGVRKLLGLTSKVPERKGARRTAATEPRLARIGQQTIAATRASASGLTFVGHAFSSLGRLLRGRAQFRMTDFMLVVQQTGAQALGIVALISFLVGIILAYIGAAQLRQFGATIFVADLVGLGMARAMGAMMTGIIMAGRTGASFAAQLGTMQVNEEIDALKTLGISPLDFLVLPRMLALILMLPLLCLYSDLLGILGGMFVAVTIFDVGIFEYYHQTREALDLVDFSIGLINAAVYGVLVAIAGCYYGIHCGRSASAVGTATTSAVVASILLIVIASAVLTVIFDILGI